MSINELPEECLLIIFDLINELDDLLNCYKVCSKWSHLIAERTRKVKYLVEYQDYGYSYTFDYVYYHTEEPIDGTCLNALFPNLMIANFGWKLREKVDHEDIVTFVKQNKSLKGIIDRFHNRDKSVFQYCDDLEMVSANYIETCMANNSASIKQLLLSSYLLGVFTTDAHYFPNLERLHIYNRLDWPDSLYDGPILSRLKIFELSLANYDAHYGFHFMDSCPNLQSAHIRLYSNRIVGDGSLKHESLQDLVLQFDTNDYIHKFNWNQSKSLLMKYPNLKHLALRNNQSLKNKGVLQLVNILPNLVLFDVRCCPKVTQEAAAYIQDYNKLYGRSIKFYFDGNYHEIESDWPHLSSKRGKISQGFDFMKHCFLKDFNSLPTFLIPSEE
ncbi:uncharacterized protein LOC107371774 isoform X2 [Tetranychus urticae]|uniref:uncharacterized protein LOC107371774 isoform X2 n=1 Tax=Tetranychus urticae TaxID=32264 RepID=UPI000D65E498|nr:uncharacterized protein LOC107371774 isoform X2 [Tetranychus urticae]